MPIPQMRNEIAKNVRKRGARVNNEPPARQSPNTSTTVIRKNKAGKWTEVPQSPKVGVGKI